MINITTIWIWVVMITLFSAFQDNTKFDVLFRIIFMFILLTISWHFKWLK